MQISNAINPTINQNIQNINTTQNTQSNETQSKQTEVSTQTKPQAIEKPKSLSEILAQDNASDTEQIDFLDDRAQMIIDRLSENMGGNERMFLQYQFHKDVSISEAAQIFTKYQDMPDPTKEQKIRQEIQNIEEQYSQNQLDKSKVLFNEVQDRLKSENLFEDNNYVSNGDYLNFVSDFNALYSSGYTRLDLQV